MVRHLTILFLLMGQFLKARMAYRADFLISLAATLVSTLMGFVFLFVLFSQIPSLDGWSFHEVLFIYGFSLVPIGLFSLMSSNLWVFGDKYIIEGNLDRVLVRPLHSLYQILCESFRIEALPDILMGCYLVFYASGKLGIYWGFIEFFMFFVFTISGGILLIAFFSMVASINFWVEDRIGLEAPLFNMIALARYPLTVYNQFLKIILSSVVPFAFVSFYPASFYLRKEQFLFISLSTPLVALFFVIICRVIWDKGIKNYGSTGN